MVLEALTESSEVSVPAEERVVLNNISWETFERLLAEAGDHRSTRFHYLDGMLELMSPLARHEGSNRFIESLITAIAEELGMNLRKLGSLTMKRPDRQAGGEPDSCYYIQNEPLIRHQEEIDLTIDPPPDLVLEVDITSPSKRRLPIYASLGVPELWRFDGKTLKFCQLNNGTYASVDRSPTFPWLPTEIVLEYLQKRLQLGEIQATQAFKAWLGCFASRFS
jgi:Uma2 family endonuclease